MQFTGMIFRCFIFIGLLMVVSAGCKPVASEAANKLIAPSPIPVNTDVDIFPTPMTTETPDPLAQELILQAKELLVKNFNLSLDEILISRVSTVVWPDASLGCPEQGVMYAQVTTPGYIILLEANGEEYVFHTDKNEQVILCDSNRPFEIFIPP